MSEIKRYDYSCDCDETTYMAPHAEGHFVKYDDHLAALAARDAVIAKFRTICERQALTKDLREVFDLADKLEGGEA